MIVQPQTRAEAVATAVRAAKPIDWVSVGLALSMPILVAMQTYAAQHPNPKLTSLDEALLIAALGSLISFGNNMLAKRKAAGLV